MDTWASELGLDRSALDHLAAQARGSRGDTGTLLELLLLLDPTRRETWVQMAEFARRNGEVEHAEAIEEVMTWFT